MRDLTTYKVSPPAPVTLTGRFLTLEPYDREKHLVALWEALGGAEKINELIRYFPNDHYETPEQFAAWLGNANANLGFVTLVAREHGSGNIVGMASYMRPDPKNGVIEVGSVAHGEAMKRSPMSTELHYLMARHVFDGLDYRRYEWKCHNENEPSKTTAKRYGFSFEGVFRQHVISRGKNRDTAWFSIIDGEWPIIKAAFEAWLAPENFDADGRQDRKLEDIRADIAKAQA